MAYEIRSCIREYLIELAKQYPKILNKVEVAKDSSVAKCEICLIAKSTKLPFGNTRTRAQRPLQIIHADTMGPISPVSHPNGYKFVVVFVDDYSRTALAYPMKHAIGKQSLLEKKQ